MKPFENLEDRYTRVHNYVLDVLMPQENKSTLCVLLVAIRCTVGWNKDTDRISLSQFERRTGMTRNTVIRAIKTCLDRGYLLRFSDDAGNYFYTLNQDFEVEQPDDGSAIIAPLDEELARLSRHPSAIIAPEVARLSRPQKTTKTSLKTNKDTTTKQSDTSAKTAPPRVDDGGGEPSPQFNLFSEFGITITAKTRPLLEKSVEEIQAWIDYAIAQGEKLENPQGRVIAGLISGYKPPNGNGGPEHENGESSELSKRRKVIKLGG